MVLKAFLAIGLIMVAGCEADDGAATDSAAQGSQDGAPAGDGSPANDSALADGSLSDATVYPDGGAPNDGALAPDLGGDGGRQLDAGAEADAAFDPCLADVVTVEGFEIFAYEASEGDDGRACSVGGVLPWTGITLEAAQTACAASGFEVCSDAQWVRACTGDSGRSWPYGGGHGPGLCNDHIAGSGALAETGAFERCATPDGIFDLSGNVWEMTADGQRRGASYRLSAASFETEATGCHAPYFLATGFYGDDLGFRCCRAL